MNSSSSCSSSSRRFTIPLVQRIAKFSCKSHVQVFLLAHVSSIFHETMRDYHTTNLLCYDIILHLLPPTSSNKRDFEKNGPGGLFHLARVIQHLLLYEEDDLLNELFLKRGKDKEGKEIKLTFTTAAPRPQKTNDRTYEENVCDLLMKPGNSHYRGTLLQLAVVICDPEPIVPRIIKLLLEKYEEFGLIKQVLISDEEDEDGLRSLIVSAISNTNQNPENLSLIVDAAKRFGLLKSMLAHKVGARSHALNLIEMAIVGRNVPCLRVLFDAFGCVGERTLFLRQELQSIDIVGVLKGCYSGEVAALLFEQLDRCRILESKLTEKVPEELATRVFRVALIEPTINASVFVEILKQYKWLNILDEVMSEEDSEGCNAFSAACSHSFVIKLCLAIGEFDSEIEFHRALFSKIDVGSEKKKNEMSFGVLLQLFMKKYKPHEFVRHKLESPDLWRECREQRRTIAL